MGSRRTRLPACWLVLWTGLALAASPLHAGLRPVDLRCDHRIDPLGIDSARPRFSWKLEDPRRGARQTAYQIEVVEPVQDGVIWDSGKVLSSRTLDVPYGGPPLQSRHRYQWRVRVWDQDSIVSAYSPDAFWETGILGAAEWKAQWIGIQAEAALLRKAFTLAKPWKRARVYVTARGLYRLRLNGQGVGAGAFTPDWTDYRQRSVYQTYDITAQLRFGENVLGSWLGKGWYGSKLAWKTLPAYRYGPSPMRLLLQVHIDYQDSSSQVIVSDASWKGTPGPIVESTLYGGEVYDARLEEPGWDAPGFDDRHWSSVSATTLSAALTAQRSPLIEVAETIPAVAMTSPSPGVTVFDFGRNVVGWVRLRVRGTPGLKVRLRHGEVLTPSGLVDTYNLRTAGATDEYVLRGSSSDEFFEPRFTYHGFRYVEVTGHPGKPALGDMVARVVHTAAPTSARFDCSSDLVNRIWASVFHSQQGNFFSVPTDCPQRDERLGWMGDARAFWRTACYNMDLSTFSAKWTRDIREAQKANGTFQDISPEIPGLFRDGTPFWSDAGVAVPWTAWRQYGDTRIIEDNYAAMQGFLAYIQSLNPNHVWEKGLGHGYGDWLAPSGNPTSDHKVIATAMWADGAGKMAEMAGAIGRSGDAASYQALFEKIKAAFNQRFVAANGQVGSGHQTPQALALVLGLLPASRVPGAVDRLVNDVQARGWHLSTGFVGTSYLLPALSLGGRDDVAYRLLLQTTQPSWGHMVTRGGTTIWERWDNDEVCRNRTSDMCSFNHFCFGGVGEWIMRPLAGIDLDAAGAGFDRIVVRPRLAPGITWAEARYESARGAIRARWENDGGNFSLELETPPNTRARIYLPALGPGSVRESGRPATAATGVTLLGIDGSRTIFEVGGGSYAFRVGGITTAGNPRIGQLTAIRLFQPARPGMQYQMAMSRTNLTGIPVPGLGTIPLDLDVLMLTTIANIVPTVFVNFRGRLDGDGDASAVLALPPMSALVGLDFHLAAVTFDGMGINYISNGVYLVVGK